MKYTIRIALILLIFSLAGNINPAHCCQQLPVGFGAADADGSGAVSAMELESYLSERLQDSLPYQKIFEKLDSDSNGLVTEPEFDNRHAVIEHFMGEGYFGGGSIEDFDDPGKDFVPYQGLNQPTHDGKIMGAIIHRFEELAEDDSVNWPKAIKLNDVPKSWPQSFDQSPSQEKSSVKDLIDATVVIGGGTGPDFFTAGAVLISEDGLAVTNYHVAEFLESGKMAGLTSDGKCCPVIEFLAGNAQRDVALIRLKGTGFAHVKIAKANPNVGDDIEVLHHSENRFFTYDRGYVMRYPTLGDQPWMEISADYAPGGSGCGIYNGKRELVGLVSIIQYGDGPSLSSNFDMSGEGGSPEEFQGDVNDERMMVDESMLMMKHAVPLTAIRSLLKPASKTRSLKASKKAK